MKTMKKLASLLLALAMIFALATTAFAASITIKSTATDDNTQSEATVYTYYQILTADIGANNTVAYYVDTQAKATALEDTGLFNVVKTGDARWNVMLKAEGTSAETIAEKLNDIKDKFGDGTTFVSDGEKATATGLNPGYYLITSSLGSKLAVQTLKDVTIDEKNTYPSNTKTEDKTIAAIGDTVTYTVEVTIPATVAKKDIVVVDTITKGLTMNTAITVAGAKNNALTTLTFVKNNDYTTEGEAQYKATIPAEIVKDNAGGKLTLTYTATINENAVVNTAEVNKAHIEYDHWVSKDVAVEVKTLGFTVKKIDGEAAKGMTNEEKAQLTALNGAEFSLWDAAKDGTQIKLIKNADGTYRVQTAKEVAANTESATITIGEATINGLDAKTYYLQEDKAPAGYNKLAERVPVTVNETTAAVGVDFAVENNAGTELPSTGGMGTTLFYVVGGILVAAAAVLLVTKKRMAN